MGLLADIEKLINEHGSAAILREKVGLLEHQRAAAIEERDKLSHELVGAKATIQTLEADKIKLQGERDAARQESDRLKQIANQGSDLPEECKNMLVVFANAPKGALKSQVFAHFRLNQAKGDYFFDQLLKHNLVHSSYGQMGVGMFYHATATGREYLAKAGLL